MLWLLEDTLHSPTLANCWAVNTNGNASNISFHVSVEKSERAELPRNRFVAGDFQGVGQNFWHPWGVPLHNGEPGDLDQHVLFLSVNLMGEVCCFLFLHGNLWWSYDN